MSTFARERPLTVFACVMCTESRYTRKGWTCCLTCLHKWLPYLRWPQDD
jgi:hypothetical protein